MGDVDATVFIAGEQSRDTIVLSLMWRIDFDNDPQR
jgi:hypothetical protein